MDRASFLKTLGIAGAGTVLAPMEAFKTLDFAAEVKDVDMKGRRIAGMAARFGNVDQHFDIIMPGAFQKSIMERGPKGKNDIFFLNSHQWAQPHGKFDELKETSEGLEFVSNPLIDTSYSSDVLKLYEAGIVAEHSIGFRTVVCEFDEKEEVRKIKEIYLYEASNVTIGANRKTPFFGFKSMTLEESDKMITKILNVMRKGTLTDETFMQLEIGLKQLQAHSVQLGIETALSGPGPAEGPTLIKEPQVVADTIKAFINKKFN